MNKPGDTVLVLDYRLPPKIRRDADFAIGKIITVLGKSCEIEFSYERMRLFRGPETVVVRRWVSDYHIEGKVSQ